MITTWMIYAMIVGLLASVVATFKTHARRPSSANHYPSVSGFRPALSA